MTPLNTLRDLIDEYGASLTRTDSEKKLQTAIVTRAVDECGLLPAAFKRVAKAVWRDQVVALRVECDAQLDLLGLLDARDLSAATEVAATERDRDRNRVVVEFQMAEVV